MASNADIFKKYGLTESGKKQTASTPSAAAAPQSGNAAIFAKYGLSSTGQKPAAQAVAVREGVSKAEPGTGGGRGKNPTLLDTVKDVLVSTGRKTAEEVSRIGGGIIGGIERSAASYTNNVGNSTYGEAARQRQQIAGDIKAWQDTIDAYRDALNDPTATKSERETAETMIAELTRRINAYQNAYGEGGANERAASTIWNAADRVSDRAAESIEGAKKGGNAIEKLGVDLAATGTEMAGDRLLSPIPGAGLIPMGFRVLGGSSQEARRNGADFEDAMAYGASNAVVEVLTEKMFDGLANLYGKGAADDIVESVIGRISKNGNVQKALKIAASAAGESAEEFVSGILSPALQSLYNKKSLGQNYSEMQWSDILYDMLVGGIMGSLGGTVEAVSGQASQQTEGPLITEREARSAGKATTTAEAPEGSLTAPTNGAAEAQKTASDEAGIQYSYIAADDAAAKKTAESSAYSRVVERGGGVTISDELLAKYDAINKNPAVKLITAVKDFYESHLAGEKVSVQLNNGVIEVKFENDGKKKAVGWRMKPDKAASFEKLLDLTRNAEYAYSELNRDTNEATSVPRFHYYIGDALVGAHIDEGGSVIGGIHMPVKIQVRDLVTDVGVQESRYYTHNLEKSKAGSDSPVAGADGANIDSNAYTPASADSISTPSQNVNREIEEPLRLKTAKELYGFEPEGYEDTADAGKATTAAPQVAGLATAKTEAAETQKTASNEAAGKREYGRQRPTAEYDQLF